MSNYYTHGSISNVSLSENSIKLHIKPNSGFDIRVNDRKYLLFVEESESDRERNQEVEALPATLLVNQAEGFYIGVLCCKEIHLLASILPYWMEKKTNLRFSIEKDGDNDIDLEFVSIEPIE